MLNIRAREAKTASNTWNVTKTLIQTSFFWVTFLYVCPYLIYILENYLVSASYRFLPYYKLSLALFICGGALGIWSGMTMALYGKGTPLPVDCPQKLVIKGPYAYVRNPMAIGGLTQGASVGLFVGSLAIILYTLAGMILWNFFVRLWEEQDLKERFGSDFELYQQNVRCWFPRLSPYRLNLMEQQ